MSPLLLLSLACSGSDAPAGGDDSGGSADDSGGSADDSGGADDTGGEPGPVFDGGDGPFGVTEEKEKVGGTDVVWYIPDGGGTLAVAWSHGFARSPDNHATWARRAASWGFLVVAPKLNKFPDHEAHGELLAGAVRDAALARGATEIAFVGHSAGGLASVLAASGHSPWAVVGLDGTDAEELGLAAAPGVDAPTRLLAGEPSGCNADGSGRLWEPSGTVDRLVVVDASHCDFESETDWVCEFACGDSDPARQEAVGAWALAWLIEQSGGDAGAWASDGEERSRQLEDGTISEAW